MLSVGGRLVLINYVLSSLSMFMLCFLEILRGVLKKLYIRNKSLTHVQYLSGDSQFWIGLMKVKNEFLSLGKFDLGDGSQV